MKVTEITMFKTALILKLSQNTVGAEQVLINKVYLYLSGNLGGFTAFLWSAVAVMYLILFPWSVFNKVHAFL